jgi:hypothetical protein
VLVLRQKLLGPSAVDRQNVLENRVVENPRLVSAGDPETQIPHGQHDPEKKLTEILSYSEHTKRIFIA